MLVAPHKWGGEVHVPHTQRQVLIATFPATVMRELASMVLSTMLAWGYCMSATRKGELVGSMAITAFVQSEQAFFTISCTWTAARTAMEGEGLELFVGDGGTHVKRGGCICLCAGGMVGEVDFAVRLN
jgi:hypothetical protein